MPHLQTMRMPADYDVDQRGSDQATQQGVEASCWICLGDASDGALRSFCACPGRHAHDRCLARWCLQQAGRDEEKHCRFCKDPLPDYKSTLLNSASVSTGPQRRPPLAPTSAPNIRVHYGNVTIVMPLQPGEQGKRDFEAGVKKILGLPQDQVLNINFSCKEPGSEQDKVQLSGLDTYDAAFWCVSHAAAERRNSLQQLQRGSSSSTSSSPTASSGGFSSHSAGFSSQSAGFSSQSEALLGSPTAGSASLYSAAPPPAAVAMPQSLTGPLRQPASVLLKQQSQRQQLQQYTSTKPFMPPALVVRTSSSDSSKPSFFKQFSKLLQRIKA